MPSEGQSQRSSTLKRIKYYSKFCVLIVVGYISIVVIPGVFLVYLNKEPDRQKHHHDHFPLTLYRPQSKSGDLPWYVDKSGKRPNNTLYEGSVNLLFASKTRELNIWPEDDESDRIETQLKFMPGVNASAVKTILIYNKFPKLGLTTGQKESLFLDCPVRSCSLSNNMKDITTADAFFFSDEQNVLPSFMSARPPHQVWILYLTKSPYHTKDLKYLSGLVNWTVSYRSDSEIAVPFEKWVYYNQTLREFPEVSKDFAAGKTKKVVWFVRDPSDYDRRKDYVEELQRYIDVDVFGGTEEYPCPCSTPNQCFKLLKKYKFFVAFEKYQCKDYITEKFFRSLQNGVLPLVTGARREHYSRSAPHNSFIHVDEFSSPRELAEYLLKLDQDDDLYNDYFRWVGTGRMIDSRVDCRLCALLHTDRHNIYSDLDSWWNDNACTEN